MTRCITSPCGIEYRIMNIEYRIMNSEMGEGHSKFYGGLGFPFRGLRGERGELGRGIEGLRD